MSKPNSTSKPVHPHTLEQVPGITLREYAAVHIASAFIAGKFTKPIIDGVKMNVTEAATILADDLIEQLQQ